MSGRREQNRAEVTARILAAARVEIAEKGGGGLSMRAIAREVGLVSSAIYRYFPTREALLTAMIIESYGHLAAALGDVAPTWPELARCLRGWARGSVHEFQLIYGTPIPGYVAPPETVPAAESVAVHFLRAGAVAGVPRFEEPELGAQVNELARGLGVPPSGVAAVLAELAALIGLLMLEISGHLVGTADPADHLFEALVRRQVGTLGL